MENPCLRLGQAHFLALHNIMPELALKIKGTDNDPFYDDSKIQAFFEFLISMEEGNVVGIKPPNDN
jgi:hypothetical protein